MSGFLSNVVQEVLHFPLRKTAVIFPTRRACQSFRDELAKELRQVSWLPKVIPIKELLDEISPLPVADDSQLLLELFKVYNTIAVPEKKTEENIDQFLSWGQQLLDDFNEIDRQLVPAALLFNRILDIKLLDATFGPDSEELNYIIEFWKQFSTEKLTPLRVEFLEYWEMLPELYSAYKKHLLSAGFVYEGLAWKLASESPAALAYFDQFDKVVFAGFYALTKTEDAIIDYLKKKEKCILFRDADTWYTIPKYQEAGRFFRKGKLSDPAIPWLNSDLVNNKRMFRICGVSGRSSMARELAIAVERELSHLSPEELKNAVVVLPDEGLLFPFLDHCSRLGISVNPSMGYPLSLHPMIPVLHSIKTIRGQLNDKTSAWQLSDKARYFLNHPVLSEVLESDDKKQLTMIADGILPDLISGVFSSLLCQLPVTVSDEKKLVANCLHNIHKISDRIPDGLQQSLLQTFEMVCKILNPFESLLSVSAWWKLVMNELDKTRIPFKTEGDTGVRVMGFLETRILDYKYVFIASLNEGTLPGNNAPKSLIPYSLRKAYHLPCQEEQDAVTAYHFYRLLQRSQKVHLFYNTELNDMGGGEKSRYLYQLHHELKAQSTESEFSYYQIQNPAAPPAPVTISISKNQEIISLLKNKYVDGFSENQDAGISPTALTSYINCSLQFYFDQVVRIRPDEKKERLEANEFGKVLHGVMQELYTEKLHQKVDALFIESKIPLVEVAVKSAIHKYYKKQPLSGHDLLMEIVLVDLVKRILTFDIENTPFELIGLEEKIRQSLFVDGIGNVFLKGTLDRIDRHEAGYSILDYKTGNDKIASFENLEELFHDPVYKVNLQLFIYVYLFRSKSGDDTVRTGIFKLKQFEKAIDFLQKGSEVTRDQDIEIENGIRMLINEIFNPEIPFQQTTDSARCTFCSYNGICNRIN